MNLKPVSVHFHIQLQFIIVTLTMQDQAPPTYSYSAFILFHHKLDIRVCLGFFCAKILFNLSHSYLSIISVSSAAKHWFDPMWYDLVRASFLKMSRSSIKLVLLGACKTHRQTHTHKRWSKWGEEDERGEHRTNSSSVYSVGRREKQKMTEEEKEGHERRGHTQRILNGYFIPWETDRTNPLLFFEKNKDCSCSW